MKRHYYALGAALLAGGVLIAGLGVVVKDRIPEDNAFLYEEHSLIALPFALLADGKLDDVLAPADTNMDILPPAESTGEGETESTVVTEETTVITSAPETEPAQTQATTIPPTEPEETTAPPTEPEVTQPSVPLEELYPVIPDPAVEPEYFDDTLFIGDSRVCGLRDYARLGDADYFCDVGMTVFNMWESKCDDYDFRSTYLADQLKRVKYGKIYVALGINECGYPVKNFKNEYQRMVEKLRQLQPDATIVLHGIMGVTREYARSLPYFQPDHIAMLNEYIASLADGERIFYIDPNDVFADPEGFLMMSLTKDGCHLIAKEHALWSQWLCSCPPVS